jgi:hypothetical protein
VVTAEGQCIDHRAKPNVTVADVWARFRVDVATHEDRRFGGDIGERIEMNPDTVCRALSRVRDALRRCLRKLCIESIHHA